jgi:sugar phosphate isomerase/epimerase
MPATAERYEVELSCTRCGRTTVHLVTTTDPALSRVMCIACGRAATVHTLQFMEQYVGGVVRRLLAKPSEITTEFARSPRDFVTSLPGRVLTKPFRVAAELRTTMDIIRPRRRGAGSQPALVPPAVPGDLPAVARGFRVLLSAPLLWAHRSDEILQIAHALGYDGVELWVYQLLAEDVDPERLAARARALDLTLTLHALSWDLNPTSRVEPIREASMDALRRSAGLARRLEASVLVMHPGHATVPHDAGEAYWPQLVDAVGELADAAGSALMVGVEHMEPRQAEYVVTPEHANRLVREVGRPNVGTVLDVAHIPWGEDEIAFLARLDRMVHVHFSDADESQLHLPLGQGRRDLQRVLRALQDYRGAMAIEGFSISAGEELARWNKARFEELWRAVSLAEA